MLIKKIIAAAVSFILLAFIIPAKENRHPPCPVYSPITDGPYLLYHNDTIAVSYIRESNGEIVIQEDLYPLSKKDSVILTVSTDVPGLSFTVKLKDKLKNEKSEYKKVTNEFILSDIEGNFRSFRKLLLAGGVIDEQLNWTFGNGHLVLTGDFFDRGNMVTEVLWLIYYLEDKAQAAGGYVHFILGNHEIMNMSGDYNYVHPKYITSSALLGADYGSLYNENSELGRWLRTKNVAERVGDILFVHGGFSPWINQMDVTLSAINGLVRPYYADSSFQFKDARLDTLYSDFGPFWYRGYYTGQLRATTATIDSTLEKFRAKYIATGHTIIADTISSHFGGKLFNTDVKHAEHGKSEALLFENGKFFRVTPLGKRIELN